VQPEAAFDLTAVFAGQLAGARRTFTRENGHSLLIEDEIALSDATETVTWQLMTTAAVDPTDSGAVLTQGGQALRLDILAPEGAGVSVVSLDPPPLALDRRIEGLKRIEIRLPAGDFDGPEGEIRVRLSAASGR
jgi:hypothetical protein